MTGVVVFLAVMGLAFAVGVVALVRDRGRPSGGGAYRFGPTPNYGDAERRSGEGADGGEQSGSGGWSGDSGGYSGGGGGDGGGGS